MVDPNIFRQTIQNMLKQDYKIEFYGTNFDKTIQVLSERKMQQIYSWIKQIIENRIRPLITNKNASYKEVPLNQILTFRKEISINNNEHRIMLLKIKNLNYIELHLGTHKYYDQLRRSLGLTNKKY